MLYDTVYQVPCSWYLVLCALQELSLNVNETDLFSSYYDTMQVLYHACKE